MFNNIYSGKRVLVTGHTGFKGTWLTTWLLQLGAEVCGISKDIPTIPSMFEALKLSDKIEHHICDIRDLDKTSEIINQFKPDFLFHLAAQPIVSLSYSEPLDTISTNVMGTANILEILRGVSFQCTAIIITSDKCYENVEWVWGYKETDPVGGRDIYSGSKGAAEVIFHAYHQSFFPKGHNVRLATGRAGNVIGGGDWAADRIVADCVKAWSRNEQVEIRCPEATRPWQHVLEPLSGYLMLGEKLAVDASLHGEQFNFGPRAEQNHTVKDLLKELSVHWGFDDSKQAFNVTDNLPFHEAGLLKLNCDKALFHLKWEATLSYKECVKLVSDWYVNFYQGDATDYLAFTNQQINEYQKIAESKGIRWL
ncbi:CDP-glucose 4,6-dehydratase [Aliivibrio fischeri]|uniref:CDP-glucose 4,6-dehydratase n=1 Tax=Aliivibrio fischeri TaxID=668 RepID=UPI00090822EA|nr:CDP-glucose 4,6-dehydratase [Aliivibrio fischeri]MUH96846.1 CDP-glucose 4,6-dehydratase [Aliivibrio fischeri]MUI63825.1 CDP-glucose 4,6-dehydratase [Aliivibrio fischeri]MUJ37264.1 CDP-glucose 4,6-dehydratase [Aliivibrio fischeri]MUK61344.1 CDP-glucose 4,6-dehydratase [Aliivibrio fischeri]MUL19467.1 CDP-glucose 4,6-dehydratase [Aliivibrio fischeri]